ncbi:MAG: TauD/TfdA family dioxygenase [Gammaproteobacteria bacterium]|jgi:taurine dioxygenase|nr:TauD/TfdA family dioxygenase [Gammaproteobacteria bacterium]
MQVEASGQACGARVTGVDLSVPLDSDTLREMRRQWLAHHVLAFPDQRLSDADLVRITESLGTLGDDPYFESIARDNPVVAVTRRADEQAPLFAESWHSDWSFKAEPPMGTCLYALTIPPVGGDTEFVNQHKVLADMPAELRARLEGRTALHSAAAGYAPEGMYGEREADSDRSMKIRYSADARAVQPHPLIRRHPESGLEGVFGCLGYIVGIEGMDQEEAQALLTELYAWQTREEFRYVHRWEEHMLVIWDNRSVLHRATGGYDGYDRELHRTTIGADPDRYLSAAELS